MAGRMNVKTMPETIQFDLRTTLSPNRLLGLWRMMAGFRLAYLGAIVTLGVATTAKTATAFLVRYLVDGVLGAGHLETQPLV